MLSFKRNEALPNDCTPLLCGENFCGEEVWPKVWINYTVRCEVSAEQNGEIRLERHKHHPGAKIHGMTKPSTITGNHVVGINSSQNTGILK